MKVTTRNKITELRQDWPWWTFIALVVCGVVAFQVHTQLGDGAWHKSWVLFNNDGPFGSAVAERSRWPDSGFACWDDLNWLGQQGLPTPPLTIAAAIRSACVPLGFLMLVAYVLILFMCYGLLRRFSNRAANWTCAISCFALLTGLICAVTVGPRESAFLELVVTFGGFATLFHGCWAVHLTR